MGGEDWAEAVADAATVAAPTARVFRKSRRSFLGVGVMGRRETTEDTENTEAV